MTGPATDCAPACNMTWFELVSPPPNLMPPNSEAGGAEAWIWPVAEFARELRFITTGELPREPATEGEKARLVPEPEIAFARLSACAEPPELPDAPDGPLLAPPRAPTAASDRPSPETPAMPVPDSACAPLLITPVPAVPVPETDGDNDPLAPEPETPAAVLDARAEPVPCPDDWLGPFRAEPPEPFAARANVCRVAPPMLRPASERAPLLITPVPDAPVPETDGENDPLAPDPETPAAVLEACAEPVPCPVDWLGPFRAEPPEPSVARADVCRVAPAMLRPASARAPLLITPVPDALVPETDGEKVPLPPEPETAPAVLDACAEPVACPLV